MSRQSWRCQVYLLQVTHLSMKHILGGLDDFFKSDFSCPPVGLRGKSTPWGTEYRKKK